MAWPLVNFIILCGFLESLVFRMLYDVDVATAVLRRFHTIILGLAGIPPGFDSVRVNGANADVLPGKPKIDTFYVATSQINLAVHVLRLTTCYSICYGLP